MNRKMMCALSISGMLVYTAVFLLKPMTQKDFHHTFAANSSWKHFNAVSPTATTNGSREYWSDCVGGEPVFSAPQSIVVKEGGTPSSEWTASLSTTDSRYIEPTKDHRKMVKNGNTYTVTETEVTGGRYVYYMFDTIASTAYVEITVPSSNFIGTGGNCQVCGIAISNGSTIGETSGKHEKDDYLTWNIGLMKYGLYSVVNQEYSKIRAAGEDWIQPNLYYNTLDHSQEVENDNATLAIYVTNDRVRTLINGKETYTTTLSDTNWVPSTLVGETHKLGIFFGNGVQAGQTITVNKELYGEDATNEFFNVNRAKQMTRSGNIFTATQVSGGSKISQYEMLSNKLNNDAVISITPNFIGDSTAYAGNSICFWDGENVDTDGNNFYGVATLQKYGISLGRANSNTIIGERNPDSWGNRGNDSFKAFLFDKSNKDATVPIGSKLTLAYHSGKVYLYVNTTLVTSFELGVNTANPYDSLASAGFKAKSSLSFGIFAYGISNVQAGITLNTELYGESAISYMKANFSEISF